VIRFEKLSLAIDKKSLLDSIDFIVNPTEKAALIGLNGSGKSTLFQVPLGEISPDTGALPLPANWRISHVSQELLHTERSAVRSWTSVGDLRVGCLRRHQHARRLQQLFCESEYGFRTRLVQRSRIRLRKKTAISYLRCFGVAAMGCAW
jgi:ATPase subunit of ABC transporter with duplicated ATPase domains